MYTQCLLAAYYEDNDNDAYADRYFMKPVFTRRRFWNLALVDRDSSLVY